MISVQPAIVLEERSPVKQPEEVKRFRRYEPARASIGGGRT